jgi:hypothetical protein
VQLLGVQVDLRVRDDQLRLLVLGHVDATTQGQILNDLTLGEYEVVITSVPQGETLEDSQFE